MVEGLKELKKNIGAEYCELLNFERRETFFFVQTKEFLGGEKGRKTWGAINKLIKQLGGHWVSAGKDSHWEIPFEATEKEAPLDAHARMQQALEHIHKAGELLSGGLK